MYHCNAPFPTPLNNGWCSPQVSVGYKIPYVRNHIITLICRSEFHFLSTIKAPFNHNTICLHTERAVKDLLNWISLSKIKPNFAESDWHIYKYWSAYGLAILNPIPTHVTIILKSVSYWYSTIHSRKAICNAQSGQPETISYGVGFQ